MKRNGLRRAVLPLAMLSAVLWINPVLAAVTGNAASEVLVQEGNALLAKNAFQPALDKYSAAAKADPGASMPVSAIAALLYKLSGGMPKDDVPKLRAQAEGQARAALKIDARDPLALEVLRLLSDDKEPPLHQGTPEARALVDQGEVQFHARHFAEALAIYEKAAQADPAYSLPLVYAADCYYVQEKWADAERLFAQAAKLEPLNGQAWRYLADALSQQGKFAAAETALINGIAAHPSQLPTWTKLASLRARGGAPLTSLHLVRKASSRLDPATGKGVVEVEREGSEQKSADFTVWLALAVSESNKMVERQKGESGASPFAVQLSAWTGALKVADELAANGGGELTEDGLKTMRMLAKADQLEAAILLLQYRESYRPDLERWKAEHPNGVKKFIDMYGLRP
jgi:tetratricopeptide (TPR) repeat protein